MRLNSLKKYKLPANASLQKLRPQGGAVVVFISFGFVLLFLLTVYLQIVEGPQSVLAAEQSIRVEREIAPARGLFYDRNGVKLVVNENSYTLKLKLSDWKDTRDQLTSLFQRLDIVPNTFWLEAEAAKKDSVVVRTGLSQAEVVELSTLVGKEAKLQYVQSQRRNYLYGPLYGQIIGYTGLPNAEEVAQGALVDAEVGKYRLEKIFNKDLSGIAGEKVTYLNTITETAGVPGNNIFLTLDHAWQQSLYKLLGKQVDSVSGLAGAAAIVEVSSGELLSYVSYPSYDPNIFEGGITTKAYQQLLQDPRKPLLDKLIGLQASPGSTFKLFSAYALLQNSVIDAGTRILSTGCIKLGTANFCEFGKRRLGNLDITEALGKSSNIFFCRTLGDAVARDGIDKVISELAQFSFGQQTGIVFEGEITGNLPSEAYKQKNFQQNWFLGDTCNMSIGQGMLTTTPLQMAMATAVLGNGGSYYRPNILQQVVAQDGEVMRKGEKEVLKTVPLAPQTASLIQTGMVKVAQQPTGTAYRYLRGTPGNVRVKTGSAETSQVSDDGSVADKVHSWVVGFFDYQGKTYAFAMHIHFGGGAWNVTPVASEFIKCLYANFPAQCQ